MSGASFLRAFTGILHALECAAVVAAPIVAATGNKEEAEMLSAGVANAVNIEALFGGTLTGPQRNQMVQDTSLATIKLINQIAGKNVVSEGVAAASAQAAGIVVDQLNTIAEAVKPVPVKGA
jgi:hypothetical protein